MTTPALGRTRAAFGLAAWLALVFGVAAVAGYFAPGEWYASLRKPSWNPPNWVFAPVWTALYLLMAVAAWLVWREGGLERHARALGWFGLQLFLNGLWSPLFFGLKRPGLAFLNLVLLWLALVATIEAFWRVRRTAAGLLLPYLAWVTFAGALNLVVWQMNR